MNKIFIYGLWDPRNYQLRYIGKSSNPEYRLKEHIQESESRIDCNSHKGNWIRQLLAEGLTPSVEILEEVSNDNWQEIEKKWIADCRKNGLILANMTDGGEGLSKGHAMSEETKEKIGEAQKGKVVSAETRKRMSKAQKGKVISERQKEQISKVHKGKKLSWAHIEAIRNANLGSNHSLGFKHTKETRRNMSNAHKNRIYSKRGPTSSEIKKKISKATSGKNNHFFGKKHTEETKQKMRDAWIRRKENS